MMNSGVSSMAVNSQPLPSKDSGAKNTLGKEAFLTLLVTQLQNQDPLKPMEDKEFTAQLAQFSSLEEMKNISKSVDSLVASQTSSSKTTAVGFIGKEVTVFGGHARVVEGAVEKLQYELEKDASIVDVAVSDASGKVVRILNLKDVKGGANLVAWDGRDSQGKIVKDGDYSFDITASDSAGGSITANTTMTGTVSAVKYELGVPYLIVGSVKVPLQDVMEVR